MNRKKQRRILLAAASLAAFALWTAVVCLVDVRMIGPQGSSVGLAGLNGFFHGLTGVHMALYTATDVLSIVPLVLMAGFALLGLWQWVSRRSLLKVDRNIIVLGGFYAAVPMFFVLFEVFVVNYRPVLIDGVLEASYPSSTTMLMLCVMPTAVMQLNGRVKSGALRRILSFLMTIFTAAMVSGRLISGVHWLSDVIGGALLSAGLVLLYAAVCGFTEKRAD